MDDSADGRMGLLVKVATSWCAGLLSQCSEHRNSYYDIHGYFSPRCTSHCHTHKGINQVYAVLFLFESPQYSVPHQYAVSIAVVYLFDSCTNGFVKTARGIAVGATGKGKQRFHFYVYGLPIVFRVLRHYANCW